MVNFLKSIWQLLDIKLVLIFALVAYIGISLAFGIGSGSSDLKKENKDLKAQNEQILKDNAKKDSLIGEYVKTVDAKEVQIAQLQKVSLDKDSLIQKLNKKKYEDVKNVDNLDNDGVLKFFSNHLNGDTTK